MENAMMYLAPAVCLIFGVSSLIYTIKVYKHGGVLKLKTLILALVGIPAFVALMLQIYGVIDNDHLASCLGQKYMMERQAALENQNN